MANRILKKTHFCFLFICVFFAVPACDLGHNQVIFDYNGGRIKESEARDMVKAELAVLEERQNKIIEKGARLALEKKLLIMESEEAGRNPEKLVSEYIQSRFKPANDKVIRDFYQKRKSKYKKPFKQVEGEIRSLFEKQQKQSLRKAYIVKLEKKYRVEKIAAN